jgi:hypothetical protein
MRPDPFSALDHVDPPDQWDDIVDRAAHDTDVRVLDEAPRRSALARPRTWVAAAAVLALVGGGIALASGGSDEDGVTTDPTSTTEPADDGTRVDGDCPFTVRTGELVPEVEPGRQPVEPELGILPGSAAPTSAHGQVDDLLVEVAVGSDLATAVVDDGLRSSIEGDVGWVEMGRIVDSGAPAPCQSVAVAVRMPMRPDDLLSRGQDLPPEPYRTRAEPVLEAVLAAISVPDGSAPGPEPAEPATIEGACVFTVDQDEVGFPLQPGRVPVEPELGILPGPAAPTFAHGDVDGMPVEVAVGTGITTTTAAGDITGVTEGRDGWFDAFLTTGTGRPGPCDQMVVAVRVPVAADAVTSGLDSDAVNALYEQATPILDAVDAAITVGSGPDEGDVPSPARIKGTLDDGSPFEVWEDPGHGLCASLGDVDLGCDDVGPVLAPDADPSTPRLGIDDCCTPLWFGYLPEGAVDVVLDSAAGERLDVDAVISQGVWALPVPAEHARDDGFDSDSVVLYVMDDGSEVPAPHVG